MTTTHPVRPHLGASTAIPWHCDCRSPHPVLLGMVDTAEGTITIKSRERVWIVRGEVVTRCPRCRMERSSAEVGQ